MEPTTNLVEAAAMLGVKQQVLTQWLQAGIVEVAGWRRRHGAAVPLEAKHLRELATVRDLRHAGVSLQAVRRAARFLRTLGLNPFSKGQFLVVAKGEVVRIADTGEAISLLREPGQRLLVPLLPLDGPVIDGRLTGGGHTKTNQ